MIHTAFPRSATGRGRPNSALAQLAAANAVPLTMPFGDASPVAPLDVEMEYWDDLFCAVIGRLTSTVEQQPADLGVAALRAGTQKVRQAVLECTAALAQLHTTLLHEGDRRRLLELAFATARSERIDARAASRRSRPRPYRSHPTALANRRAFCDAFDRSLAAASPEASQLAVLRLDLDGVERVRATHGAAAADDMVGIVTTRLLGAVRGGDTVGRVGNDAFACLFVGVPERRRLDEIASTLRTLVAAPLKVGEFDLSARPSVGLAVYPSDGTTVSALLASAEAAMYRAEQMDRDDAPVLPTATLRDLTLSNGAEPPTFGTRLRGPSDEQAFNALATAFADSGGLAHGDDLARLLQQFHPGEDTSLAGMLASGRAFGFEQHGTFWVPMFQVELHDVSVRQSVGQVLAALGVGDDGWAMAHWFIRPNARLDNRRPVDLMSSALPAVLDAARADRFAATG
jgi:diguanylate cyclase (GGDEF)-like protein